MSALEEVAELAAAARQLREVSDAAQADYIAAVRAAQAAGVSVAEIARAAGVSREGLYKALRARPIFEDGMTVAERTEVRAAARARQAERTPEVVRAERKAARQADLAAYRIERARQLAELERITGGYATDHAEHVARGGRPAITYREWLQSGRGATA